MAKELVISAGRHETRVAIMEDDQLVEIYFQRANEYSLAGSIHKGRVTRVLPGMQSAFVDVGLERDTFLYVSDFFEENEEIEKMPETQAAPERDRGRGREREGGRDASRGRGRDRDRREPQPIQATAIVLPVAAAAPVETPVLLEHHAAQQSAVDDADLRRGNRRRRRVRPNQGGNFPESKFAGVEEDESVTDQIEAVVDEKEDFAAPNSPITLPGESLSKYAGRSFEVIPAAKQETAELEAAEEEDDEVELESPVVESRDAIEGSVTPLKAITPQSLAQQREAEVLEEVKEHLAEIAKEKEEERDFEDAARIVHQDHEQDRSVALMASEDEPSDVGQTEGLEGDEEVDEAEAMPLAGNTAPIDASGSGEVRQDEQAEPAAETSGVLPSLGYSAHLRQTDQSLLQQRPPQDEGEGQDRGGRRRRRGRGRDRESTSAPALETAAPTVADAEQAAIPAVEGTPILLRREEVRRDGRTRRDRDERTASDNTDRSDRTERTDRTDRTDRPASSTGDRAERPDRERRVLPSITELLKEGQEILVQIAKEPLGQKGARITSHIALPGRYCVYMPTVDHTGVSRKIASDEERLRLKRILQSRKEGIPGGFIIRTAGEGRSEADILADIDFLHNLWIDIRRKADSKPAPALIYHDLEIVERVLRDQLGPEFKSIWVDTEEIYESILRFLERFQPQMVSRVKMYTRQASIFDNFGITQELEKALRPKVWLKSGGYIVINQTEALVAIDINTGKFVGKSNRLEDTIVKTNVEAIREIVRQVRLRDLGGIIVIDFIDMDERKNRMRVMQALEEAMRADRAPYKILQFNDFGLVAITRKRVKQSLERTLCAPCPYCEGSAYVKSVQTVVGEILNEAKKLARALEDSKDVLLRVNPEVAKVFKSSENQFLEELEEIVGRPVMVVSDGLIHQEKFDLA